MLSAPALAKGPSQAPPKLTSIHAAHHRGFDRLVFQFAGGLPGTRTVKYVQKVIADGSGKVVPVAGAARLAVVFSPAAVGRGLNELGFALPGLLQAVQSGNFEGVVSYGVGVAKKEPVHLSTLANPARFVIDIPTPYRTVTAHVFLADSHGGKPVKAVSRPVIAPALAVGAMQRLFAGPTPAEIAAGLRLVSSDATGFKNLTISAQVARIQLTGGCNSHGNTLTIANEIMPTLKQFSSIRWVKIYDPAGHTEHPTGHSDSIPTCLEP
ncbi:MAG TPA: hypothetical protein VFI65_24865 [Streptosporangiaceae bacterium]|nr:hypothetical protein [Streptosporangiaceae bacterium]